MRTVALLGIIAACGAQPKPLDRGSNDVTVVVSPTKLEVLALPAHTMCGANNSLGRIKISTNNRTVVDHDLCKSAERALGKARDLSLLARGDFDLVLTLTRAYGARNSVCSVQIRLSVERRPFASLSGGAVLADAHRCIDEAVDDLITNQAAPLMLQHMPVSLLIGPPPAPAP
jgi:hypothetical protein